MIGVLGSMMCLYNGDKSLAGKFRADSCNLDNGAFCCGYGTMAYS